MQKEPAIIIGLIVAFVNAAIVAVVKLGLLAWTPEQQTTVAAALVAAAALIQALVTRGKVWAPATVAKIRVQSLDPIEGE